MDFIVTLVVSFLTFFVGLLVGLKSKSSDVSYDGQMIILTPEDGKKIFSLEIEEDPEVLVNKKAITFKVVPVDSLDTL